MRIIWAVAAALLIVAPARAQTEDCRLPQISFCKGCLKRVDVARRADGCHVRYVLHRTAFPRKLATLRLAPAPAARAPAAPGTLRLDAHRGPDLTPAAHGALPIATLEIAFDAPYRSIRRPTRPPLPTRRCFESNFQVFCE